MLFSLCLLSLWCYVYKIDLYINSYIWKLFILAVLFTQLSEYHRIYLHLLLLIVIWVVSSFWQLSVNLLGTFLFVSFGKHKHLFLFHITIRVKLLDCNVCVCVCVCVCMDTHTHTHICSASIIIAKHSKVFVPVYAPITDCVVVVLSRVWLFATPWTVAHPAPLSMGFCSPEYWSGLPFPSPGHLPNPGIKPASSASPALAGGFFTTELPGKLQQPWGVQMCILINIY